jgi:hypothetical protein
MMTVDRTLVAKIYKVALESRSWAEEQARFSGRDPDILMGMCVHAAFDLFKRLEKAGLHPIFAKSRHHAFCLVEGLVVDVTATQFANCDPVNGVWIADLSDEEDLGVWAVEDQAASVEAITALSCWDDWALAELPFYQRSEPAGLDNPSSQP